MKKLFALLVLAILALPVMAQDTHPWALPFYINLSPLEELPPNTEVSQTARFWHTDPFYGSITNFLAIDLPLPARPVGAWISERKNNGALIPVLGFTNILGDDSYGYISQLFVLNQKQIRSLAQGDWYLTVDLGGSNHLSHLTPQYQFAFGPTAAINFETPIYQQSYRQNTTVFIARNNQDAKVVINGSSSFDPLYLPKAFSWEVFEGDYGDSPTILSSNTGTVVTYDLSPGFYDLRLQVDDTLTAGGAKFFNVEVITPSQAVAPIIQEIEYLQLPDNTTQTLVGTLTRASQLFDQGDVAYGCVQLQLFTQQVKPLHFLGTVDDSTSQSARRIIAVLGFSIPSKIIQFED